MSMNVFLHSDYVKIFYEQNIQVFLMGELWYYSDIYIYIYIYICTHKNDGTD